MKKHTLDKQTKRQFNALIYAAQGSENQRDFTKALQLYQSALKIVPNHDKLPIKIEQIKIKIADSQKQTTTLMEHDLCGFRYISSSNKYTLKERFSLTPSIFVNLLPHQRVAVRFLWERHLEERITGCILGDDMGLGKTIEILAFIYGLYMEKHSKTFLLIVPAMVANQWKNEAEKWCPGVTLYNVHGLNMKAFFLILHNFHFLINYFYFLLLIY